MDNPELTDKYAAQYSFGRAANTYDKAAVLQQEVLRRMLERLDYIKYQPKFILDVGTGTGAALENLIKRYPKADLIALDFAFNMLKVANDKLPFWKRLPFFGRKRERFLCADMDRLPFKSSCVGMIWSNLTFQWSNELLGTLKEMFRVLHTEGLLMFSTFGPDTLKELKKSFSSADRYSHVNRFTDMHDIGDMLVEAGFSTPVMDMEYITLTYSELKDLMMDLRSIGAHNVTQGRRRGLTGKNIWLEVQMNYERLRVEGKLPATFEIIYGHAWKPEARVTAEGHQIIKLDSLRKKAEPAND